jgi:hypothetical protein
LKTVSETARSLHHPMAFMITGFDVHDPPEAPFTIRRKCSRSNGISVHVAPERAGCRCRAAAQDSIGQKLTDRETLLALSERTCFDAVHLRHIAKSVR